jgi:hypothetical protein
MEVDMSSTTHIVVATAVLSVVVVGYPGTARGQGTAPRTEPVSGTFVGSPVNVRQRVCEGRDGPYLEIRGHFSGTIASSDPRLTGTIDFMAEPALVNLATGFGTFKGTLRVSDAMTSEQTAHGQFFTVVTEASLNHGFAVGNVMNAGGGAADAFFVRFESTFDPALNVSGAFGGVGDPRTPGVIQGGHCTGPFTRMP